MYNFLFVAMYKHARNIKGANDPRWSGSATVTFGLITLSFFLVQIFEFVFNIDLIVNDSNELTVKVVVGICIVIMLILVHKYYNEKKIEQLLSQKKYKEQSLTLVNAIKFILILFGPLVAAIYLLNNYNLS